MLEVFLESPVLMQAAVVFIVALLAFFAAKIPTVIAIFRIVFKVWHFVEKLGAAERIPGYQKLAVFMELLHTRFYEHFDRNPTGAEEGIVMRILHFLISLENHMKKGTVTENFSDGPEPKPLDPETL